MESYLYDIAFALVFTFIGYRAAVSFNLRRSRIIIEETIGVTVDKLVKDGYIKTNGSSSNPEILKWWEKSENEGK